MGILKTKFGPGWLASTLLGAASGVASLDSTGKLLTSQIPSGLAGGLNFKGTFDASQSTFPASPSNGDLYVISVAGNPGSTLAQALAVGDYIFYSSSASAWEPIYAPQTTDKLVEGTTNLFFTSARAQTAAVVNSLTSPSATQAPSGVAVANALATKQASFIRFKERFTLAAADVTNGYITLSHNALPLSMTVGIQGVGLCEEQTTGSTGDYSLSPYANNANTKVTWLNDFASGGAAALAAGDVIFVHYSY